MDNSTTNGTHEPSGFLSAEDIWAAHDVAEEAVDMPEWGGRVKIRALTIRKSLELQKQAQVWNQRTRSYDQDTDKLYMLLLLHGIVEPALSADDIDKMAEKSAVATTRIVTAIQRISGLSEEAVREADKSVRAGSPASV